LPERLLIDEVVEDRAQQRPDDVLDFAFGVDGPLDRISFDLGGVVPAPPSHGGGEASQDDADVAAVEHRVVDGRVDDVAGGGAEERGVRAVRSVARVRRSPRRMPCWITVRSAAGWDRRSVPTVVIPWRRARWATSWMSVTPANTDGASAR